MADPDLSQFMTKTSGGDPDLSAFMGAPALSDADQHLLHPQATDLLTPQRKPLAGRTGAFVRGATRGVIPAGTAAMGAATGAEIGALGGPLDPATVPIGALVGGGLGYWAGKKAQQSVFDNLPKGALTTMGQDPASVKLDQLTYPVTAALSELAPSVVAGGALQRSLTSPEIADMAMLTTPKTAATAPSVAGTINATRAAAQRQGLALPTTLTSPTGYAVSRAIPKVFGGSAIETAESAAPQAVGSKLQDLAATYLKPTDPGEAGAAVQDAAAAWAEKQRLTGGNLIESAGKQVAGIPLAPTSTLNYIDTEISAAVGQPYRQRGEDQDAGWPEG